MFWRQASALSIAAKVIIRFPIVVFKVQTRTLNLSSNMRYAANASKLIGTSKSSPGVYAIDWSTATRSFSACHCTRAGLTPECVNTPS